MPRDSVPLPFFTKISRDLSPSLNNYLKFCSWSDVMFNLFFSWKREMPLNWVTRDMGAYLPLDRLLLVKEMSFQVPLSPTEVGPTKYMPSSPLSLISWDQHSCNNTANVYKASQAQPWSLSSAVLFGVLILALWHGFTNNSSRLQHVWLSHCPHPKSEVNDTEQKPQSCWLPLPHLSRSRHTSSLYKGTGKHPRANRPVNSQAESLGKS